LPIILRKLRSFLKDPLGTAVWYALEFRDWGIDKAITPPVRRVNKWWSKEQLTRRGLIKLLSTRPKHAYPPDHADLWFLYRMVRERKPQCILEFGAGCSTVIMAQALLDNASGSTEQAGRLYSVDTVPFWADISKDLMPAHLKEIVKISCSEVVEVVCHGVTVLHHAQVPDVIPDFIYLDGPDFTAQQVKIVCDPVEIEGRLRKGFCMVVDGRTENTKFLKDRLSRRYTVSHNWPLEPWKTSVFQLLQ
jgi:hypothetical protein